ELAVPPFRWLGLAAMFCALLGGATVERLLHSEFVPINKRRLAWLALGILVASNLVSTVSGVILTALRNPSFVHAAYYMESSMTPASTTHPEALPDTAKVVIEPEGGTSEVVSWKSQSREIRVSVDQPSRVRLKTYNFAGWTAWVDGKRMPIGSDPDGIQVVEVPAGVHTIDVRFLNTSSRWAGTIL